MTEDKFVRMTTFIFQFYRPGKNSGSGGFGEYYYDWEFIETDLKHQPDDTVGIKKLDE